MCPGGGGLVILPHKSWNVWNKDNQSKVKKDQQKFNDELKLKNNIITKIKNEVRFKRLNGENISDKKEEQLIQNELDKVNWSRYIIDDHNRNNNNNNNNNNNSDNDLKGIILKKRKMNKNDEHWYQRPTKRHKRNDVSIIEDHYNKKKEFTFNPEMYHEIKDDSYQNEFKYNDKLDKNGNNGDFKLELGRTGKKSNDLKQQPWYMNINDIQKKRHNLMKHDSIQRTLPYHFKETWKNTDELQKKVNNDHKNRDPLLFMNTLLKHKHNDNHSDMDSPKKRSKKRSKKKKSKHSRSKKKRKKKHKRSRK